MRIFIIILVGMVSSCKAQKNLSIPSRTDTIRYYSEQCNLYLNYKREYLNDSVYVERHGDVSDTLMLKGGCLYLLHRNINYKIIDATTDFNDNNGKYHYYYYGLSDTDTLRRKNESDVQYKLRLYQSIVIYVPIKATTLEGKETFSYYILRECYPITKSCIKSKIVNGQYGIVYFEKGIGYTGHSAANANCSYRITDESYIVLTRRSK